MWYQNMREENISLLGLWHIVKLISFGGRRIEDEHCPEVPKYFLLHLDYKILVYPIALCLLGAEMRGCCTLS